MNVRSVIMHFNDFHLAFKCENTELFGNLIVVVILSELYFDRMFFFIRSYEMIEEEKGGTRTAILRSL